MYIYIQYNTFLFQMVHIRCYRCTSLCMIIDVINYLVFPVTELNKLRSSATTKAQSFLSTSEVTYMNRRLLWVAISTLSSLTRRASFTCGLVNRPWLSIKKRADIIRSGVLLQCGVCSVCSCCWRIGTMNACRISPLHVYRAVWQHF